MPVHLTPLTRRQCLSTSLAVGAGVLTLRPASLAGAERAKVDPDCFALVADTHIPPTMHAKARGTDMTANLKAVVAELAAMKPCPAGVLVAGDCALRAGHADAYTNLARLLAPLAEAKLPVHLAAGNHDHRERMYTQFKAAQPAAQPVQGKRVTIVESAKANWFLLDSLWKTNVVTGVLGKAQLAWLAEALDSRKDKPAIVVAHHNPQPTLPRAMRVTGLKETAALFEIMAARAHVKAYVYGHTHVWRLSTWKGVHLINVPPSAYVFSRGRPNGWVLARLRNDGVTLWPRCLDAAHAVHGKEHKLTWRPDKA